MAVESDDYERLVQSVAQELVGVKVKVHHKKKYKGVRSKRSIVVDLSFKHSVLGGAEVLVLIECKCYKQNVDVSDVEEFQTKLNDIGAHKGVMVTTVGYKSGAIKTAKGYKIALARLTKDSEVGELQFVVKTGSMDLGVRKPTSFQGNLRALPFAKEEVYRFENGTQFVDLLLFDLFLTGGSK